MRVKSYLQTIVLTYEINRELGRVEGGVGGSKRVWRVKGGSGRLVMAFLLCGLLCRPCRRTLQNLWDP